MRFALVNAILFMVVMAYIFSAIDFLRAQNKGDSFIRSFDRALIKGGCLFLLGSGTSFVVVVYDNLPVYNYA